MDNDYVDIVTEKGEKLHLKKIPPKEAIYHNIEKENGEIYFVFNHNEQNKKYVNEEGYELILDKNNQPVYDPVVVGTYNFYTYSTLLDIPDKINHKVDIDLWKKYGTGPRDKTTKEEREKIGSLFLGYKIQNNYDKFKAKKELKIPYSEVIKTLNNNQD